MVVREGKQGTDEEPTPIYDSVAGDQAGDQAGDTEGDRRVQAGDMTS